MNDRQSCLPVIADACLKGFCNWDAMQAQNDMNWAEMVNVRRIDNLKVSQNLQLFVNSDDIDTAPNSIVIMVWDVGPFRRSFSHDRMGCVTVWIIIAPSRRDFQVECLSAMALLAQC